MTAEQFRTFDFSMQDVVFGPLIYLADFKANPTAKNFIVIEMPEPPANFIASRDGELLFAECEKMGIQIFKAGQHE
jgi:hypothetical protein